MSKITRYQEKSSRITRVRASGVKPEPVYPGWTNFVSQKSVRAIALGTKSSCLWLATWGGVIAWKWKGDPFYQRYSSEHGMASNEVACLCLDESDRPWVGHSEGGLSYFDGKSWQVYSYLQTESIRALASAGCGSGVWVAVPEMVYYIGEPDKPPIPIAAVPEDGTIDTLALLAQEEGLLIGNPWGLFRASIDQPPEPIAAETIQSCTALAAGRNGRIWIGTPEGLYLLENDEVKVQQVSGRVLALAVAQKRVWVLTTDGLFQTMDDQWFLVNINKPCEVNELPTIRAIAASTSDTYLWVGTDQLLAQVQMINSTDANWNPNWLNLHPEDNLSNLGRCVVCQPGSEEVWVGTVSGLFTNKSSKEWELCTIGDIRAISFNPNDADTLWLLNLPYGVCKLQFTSDLEYYQLQPLNLPLILTIGQDNLPYALTERGLWSPMYQTSPEAQGVPPYSQCLTQTIDGLWWLGTAKGLYRLLRGQWQFVGEQPGPLEAAVYALLVFQKTLWVATENGIWTLQENRWVQHLESHSIWALAPSRSSALWLACKDGVVCYNPSALSISKRYTCTNSGLGSHRVTALVESAQALWLITQVGISRVSLD